MISTIETQGLGCIILRPKGKYQRLHKLNMYQLFAKLEGSECSLQEKARGAGNTVERERRSWFFCRYSQQNQEHLYGNKKVASLQKAKGKLESLIHGTNAQVSKLCLIYTEIWAPLKEKLGKWQHSSSTRKRHYFMCIIWSGAAGIFVLRRFGRFQWIWEAPLGSV